MLTWRIWSSCPHLPSASFSRARHTRSIVQIVNNDMEVPVSRAQVERNHRLGPRNSQKWETETGTLSSDLTVIL